jgi:undecaprenyl-diphosphatase
MINELISNLLSLPNTGLNHWGYWLVIVSAMAEATPMLGILIPGQTFVIAGGFLAKIGVLNLWSVIALAALGAIVGDFIGYIIGKYYGHNFLLKYGKYFFFREKYYEKTRELMRENRHKALIIGRFNSLTRAFAPFIAGSSGVKLREFIPCNIIGGLAWAIVFVLVGYLFGASYEVASKYIGRVVFGAVIVSIILIYGFKYINSKKHLFTRYQVWTLIINILALSGFAKIIDAILENEKLMLWDKMFSLQVIQWWSDRGVNFFHLVTTIGGPWILPLFIGVTLLVLLLKKKFYHFALLFFGSATGLFLEMIVKLILQRERPLLSWVIETGYSFPSGHATMAMIVFGTILYAFQDDIKNVWKKWAFLAGNVLMILLIGFSRIYLHAHWLSDVLGGYCLGLFVITLWVLILKLIIYMVGAFLERVREAIFRTISRFQRLS